MPWDRRRARKEPIQTGAAYIQFLGGVEFVEAEGFHFPGFMPQTAFPFHRSTCHPKSILCTEGGFKPA
jgi:hypothetical protein